MKSKINKNLINFYERENLKYQIKISNAQQKSFPFFELQPCGKEKRISFKIKDINIRTTQFYKVRKPNSSFSRNSHRRKTRKWESSKSPTAGV